MAETLSLLKDNVTAFPWKRIVPLALLAFIAGLLFGKRGQAKPPKIAIKTSSLILPLPPAWQRGLIAGYYHIAVNGRDRMPQQCLMTQHPLKIIKMQDQWLLLVPRPLTHETWHLLRKLEPRRGDQPQFIQASRAPAIPLCLRRLRVTYDN